LRFVHIGNRLLGFLDARKLVEIELAEPLPADAHFALLGGWGTNVAWREISLSDEADLSEWPRETLPEPTGRKYLEVRKVRGLSDKQPDDNTYFVGEKAGLRFDLWLPQPTPDTVRYRLRLVNIKENRSRRP